MKEFLLKVVKLFSLEDDCASYDEIHERMVSGAVVRGTNLWILVLAIFIASVGLNMNSTAVIIGAMLISPLMGSIMAIGYGIATDDTELAKNSAKKLALQVAVCLITSTIYFTLSPISEAKSELLARTSPTIWDVVIACCGGLAGVIGTTRKEKTNVIPGVAIATALMPPLCTAGYSISILSLKYFVGAMYLFFINGFFICLSTAIICVILRLPKKGGLSLKAKGRIRRNISLVATITILPSIYLAYVIVTNNIKDNNINKYLENEFNYEDTQILKHSKKDNELNITLIGQELSNNELDKIKKATKKYNIEDVKVNIKQLAITDKNLDKLLSENKKAESNEEEINELQTEVLAYKSQLESYEKDNINVEEITKEVKSLFPTIKTLNIGYLSNYDDAKNTNNKEVYVVIKVSEKLQNDEKSRLISYLKVVTKKDTVNLIENIEK